MQTLELSDYHIHIGPLEESLPSFMEGTSYSQIVVLVDENTERHCLPLLAKALGRDFQSLWIPPGEKHKNFTSCQYIWKNLLDKNIDRSALMINLGGGVIGDMGGFCAATFKRGIDFVQVPTTLLAQVDASIGGKLGIDFGKVKNSIGLFEDPRAVFIDPGFLDTLPRREVRSGFAEIVKHSLIADSRQWDQLREIVGIDRHDWPSVIEDSLRVKYDIVIRDPFEKSIRKALNFGHTIGHAVESRSLDTDRPLLHGEAIAIGMICESYLSSKKKGLSEDHLHQITQYLLHHYGHYELKSGSESELIALMKNDKKNVGDAISFSLISEPGTVHVDEFCEEELIRESLTYYREMV